MPSASLRVPAVIFWLVLAALGAPAGASGPDAARVVPLQVTGDPAARFSMVVLGDGYTAAEQADFRAEVDRHLNVLWSIEPFRSYRSYINVYVVEVVSGASGITCDPATRQRRETPLRMAFRDGCTDPNARAITVDRDMAVAYARRATPDFDQILVLANTDTYGGIGGSIATTSGGNALGPLITPHELGHSLGRLQDEYTYSARGKPGDAYTGGEPASIHLTRFTDDEMRDGRRKWWRWLGAPGEAGGVIGRYEGGLSRTSGIWRPSRHSMMISLGYYFDQVARERMTERISEQVALIAASTPAGPPVARNEVVWIETPQPVYHTLDVAWQVDGQPVASAPGQPWLDLGALSGLDIRTVTVTVVDPTPFVRDPEIRARALTATRSWTVGRHSNPAPATAARFVRFTSTDRSVGGREVVHVVVAPAGRVPQVAWHLNGGVVEHASNSLTFALDGRLPPGLHRLRAAVIDPGAPGVADEREWIVDNTPPTVEYVLSAPVSSRVDEDGVPHYRVRDEFTMQLLPADDQPGHVVAEFRVNGDGWHHYYGWPDAPPGTPFRFTPRGTTIKELVYGSLSAEGLSPQPWEPRQPGWGTHEVEYRAIDAAGNIGVAKKFRVTVEPGLTP